MISLNCTKTGLSKPPDGWVVPYIGDLIGYQPAHAGSG
jgi:hypothetical protein